MIDKNKELPFDIKIINTDIPEDTILIVAPYSDIGIRKCRTREEIADYLIKKKKVYLVMNVK